MISADNQNNKVLLSIAIPTYNRADFLNELLSNIITQAKPFQELIEICISNNGSSDNTKEIIFRYKNIYKGAINYNENKTNLGYDRNFNKVIEMANGKFVWLLCDDDNVVAGGLGKVIDFIKNHCNANTGLVFMGHESYYIDKTTKKRLVYFDTVEKDKPRIYEIDFKNIIGLRSDNSFGSVLLFNNFYLKKIFDQEQDFVKKAIGSYYIHTLLYQLMLIKYTELKILKFNEKIIDVDLHYYKFYIEDIFELYYTARRKFADLLLSSRSINNDYKNIIIKAENKVTKNTIKEIGCLKAFDTFNFISFIGCIKLFFLKAKFKDAIFISVAFIYFYIMPSFILRNIYRIFIKLKYKDNSEKIWFNILTTYTKMSKGERRVIC